MDTLRIREKLARGARGIATELAHPGESDLSGATLWRIGEVAVALTIVATNLAGACAVVVVALFVIPLPALPAGVATHVRLVSFLAAVGYVAVAVPVGATIGIRRLLWLRRWLAERRPADHSERQAVLSAPGRLAVLQAALWLLAAAGFGVLESHWSGQLGVRVAVIVATTGLTTAACAYLLTERLMRPVAARALADAEPEKLRGRGVATRALLAWAFGSGVPILGLTAVGLFLLAGQRATLTQVGIAIVTLCGVALGVGLLAVSLAARATADPIESVRRVLAEVQRGNFDVSVPVYDGTQVGQLQRGFNQMAAGLAERERIREAFGTYVDPEVAERVLREGTSLEGEDVEVTIMFVDVRDFTPFAEAVGGRRSCQVCRERKFCWPGRAIRRTLGRMPPLLAPPDPAPAPQNVASRRRAQRGATLWLLRTQNVA